MGLETLPDGSKIIRLEDRRPQSLGAMVVTQAPDYDLNPFEALIDLEPLNGGELLAQYQTKQARFATAPFDPDGRLLRFYPGGITVWSGFPGAGKTTLLRQFICHTLHRGSSVFLASLEEDPRDVLVRLAATAAGGEPTKHQMQWFIDAYAERFRLWGIIGIASHLRILGAARTLAAVGIKHVVIDSLMCLDVANDDFEAQRKFANLVAATARSARIHIHLVAHPRKLARSDQELDLNDIAGARELGGIADNVIFIRRDPNRQSYAQNADITPMCVSIRKQRHFNGALGDCEGWFQRPLRQFSKEQFIDAPKRYLPDDAYVPMSCYPTP
jgi:KaiC/GvpD/RAD55 family RecA-like ATPase